MIFSSGDKAVHSASSASKDLGSQVLNPDCSKILPLFELTAHIHLAANSRYHVMLIAINIIAMFS